MKTGDTGTLYDKCHGCGMPCAPNAYHPYAACLMFKACGSSAIVAANMDAVVRYGQEKRAARVAASVELAHDAEISLTVSVETRAKIKAWRDEHMKVCCAHARRAEWHVLHNAELVAEGREPWDAARMAEHDRSAPLDGAFGGWFSYEVEPTTVGTALNVVCQIRGCGARLDDVTDLAGNW